MPETPYNVCVLRDAQQCAVWTVGRCLGPGQRDRVESFSSFQAAADHALSERDRVRSAEGLDATVHFPDDCPCSTGHEQAKVTGS